MTSDFSDSPVLLVEDDPAVRQTLEVLLHRLHLHVVSAGSSREAMQYLETHCVSGLITDVVLGDGNGLSVAAFALERNPLLRVGIISGMEQQIPEELQGRVLFLAKPFSLEELRRFVEGFPKRVRPA